jgi:hypothetical protein
MVGLLIVLSTVRYTDAQMQRYTLTSMEMPCRLFSLSLIFKNSPRKTFWSSTTNLSTASNTPQMRMNSRRVGRKRWKAALVRCSSFLPFRMSLVFWAAAFFSLLGMVFFFCSTVYVNAYIYNVRIDVWLVLLDCQVPPHWPLLTHTIYPYTHIPIYPYTHIPIYPYTHSLTSCRMFTFTWNPG